MRNSSNKIGSRENDLKLDRGSRNLEYGNPLPRNGRAGDFLDRFGNEWTKGLSRTKGEPFEWDVQLSPDGNQAHINVSLKGEVTH